MTADPWLPSPAARPIWHLASGYASARRRRHPLWMLEAYFDDSGRGQDPVFLLAGFLSTAERWAAFNEGWRAELDRKPCLERFKMQHAMTGIGIWRTMRQEDRYERIARFQAVVHKHASVGFACVVRHDAFNELMRARLNFTQTVYWLGFMGVVHATMRQHEQAGLKDKVDFVFDRQKHEFTRALKSFMGVWDTDPYLRAHLAGTPRESTDDDALPLQASDYLAWQMRRLYADRENPTAARRLALFPPGQYVVQDGDIPIMTDVIDAEVLRQLGDDKLTRDLATLEAEDLPARMKDYVRRVLTARLRGEPEPPLPDGAGAAP